MDAMTIYKIAREFIPEHSKCVSAHKLISNVYFTFKVDEGDTIRFYYVTGSLKAIGDIKIKDVRYKKRMLN